jgi:hypothetical protein
MGTGEKRESADAKAMADRSGEFNAKIALQRNLKFKIQRSKSNPQARDRLG